MSIRILLLEDVAADSALIERHLKKAGLEYESRRVETRADFEQALAEFAPDLVLSDHGLPGFDGSAALQFVKERVPGLPVILVTGSLNEEAAVEFIKAGAADYILKDRLTRLPQAIRRALRERDLQRERERAAQILQETAARLQGLMDNVADGVFTIDEQGRIETLNPAAVKIFGYDAEQVIGQSFRGLMAEPFASEYDERLRAYLETGVPTILGRTREIVGRRCDRTHFPVDLAVSETQIGARRVFIATARDLTERKRLEDQFRQAQKMEAVGRLAAGVAHDFNNLLTAIIGSADLTLEALPDDSSDRENLQEIKGAAQRAAGLTRQLLTFSRQQVVSPTVLQLNDVLGELEKLLRRLLGEDVLIHSALSPDCGAVLADAGQIEQVVVNLAVNARDAMPEGGSLTIETQNIDLEAEYPTDQANIPPGRYVMLCVSDTGTGMDAQTKARVFEPFFTTKPVGKGTGLGLATVYGVVKQSGGYIWVYSEVGHGTSFKIFLPRVDAASQPVLVASAPSITNGTGTILVAEDEAGVRQIMRRVLETRGYTVLTARDGGEAMAMAEGHRGPIDLLMSDVVMPDMNGRELARRLTAIRPTLQVLFLSGYTDDAIFQHGVLQPGVFFLQKPFSPGDLARKVQDVLAARSSAA